MLYPFQEVRIVGEATQARQAVQAIHDLKPDLVILDLRLADDSSGIDVLRQVKQIVPPPLVIILTNYPYPQYQKRCLDAGADFFFDKSTQFDRLAPIVKRVLRTSHSHKRGAPPHPHTVASGAR